MVGKTTPIFDRDNGLILQYLNIFHLNPRNHGIVTLLKFHTRIGYNHDLGLVVTLAHPPEHDHQEPFPPVVHFPPPEHAHQPTQHSRPVDGLPGHAHQPTRHSRPVDGLPGRQPNRHTRPVDALIPPVHQPKPKSKSTRQSRPHHGTSTHSPPHENVMYPEQSRTKPITWCGAVFCVILWLVIILGSLLVLIIYLIYRPRTPHFEISTPTLNAVYLDMGYLVNADLTVLVNFTNPNKKVNVDFSYVILQLYFERHLIANQYIEPFSTFRAENKLANVEMVSSQVRLPMAVTQKLVTQLQRNRIMFEIDGIFHSRSNFGSLLRYSYWLYGHCNIEMTGPPSGITVSSVIQRIDYGIRDGKPDFCFIFSQNFGVSGLYFV